MIRILTIFILICYFLIADICYGQPDTGWIRRYHNGSSNTGGIPKKIKIDHSNNIIVCGIITIQNNFYWNCGLIKYAPSGDQLWIRIFIDSLTSNGGDIKPTDMILDDSDNIYVTGSIYVGPQYTGNDDFFILKYNSSGLFQWVRTYDGPLHEYDDATAITIDNHGNIIITGYINYINGPDTSLGICTIKYNSSGNLLWSRYKNAAKPTAICSDDNGNIFVTGSSGLAKICTIKYSNVGDTVWTKLCGIPATVYNMGIDIKHDKFGNIYVTAAKSNLQLGNYLDICTIKYSSSGDSLWAQIYDGTDHGDDLPAKMVVDDSGNVYVTGYSWSYTTNFDYVTIKYNTNGIQQWVSKYDAPMSDDDEAQSISLDKKGNVYVTGFSIGSYIYPYDDDYCTIKYNQFGTQQWVARYNGNYGNGARGDWAYDIVVDNDYNVYVTGESCMPNYIEDFCTIKYSQTIGIKPFSNEIPNKYELYQNYPNPFNPTTKIKYAVPSNVKGETSKVKIIIYDILGREVATLLPADGSQAGVNENLSPGTYEVEWSATGGGSNFASGVYFYQLIADGNIIDTKKMILMK